MHYGAIRTCDVANGPGCRVTLFVSGCRNNCPGCFNKEAQDFNYGREFTQDNISQIINAVDKSYIAGLTILGGEPMEPENQQGIATLISQFRWKFGTTKTIWLYTGYVLEKDLDPTKRKWIPGTTDYILENVDVLVDGPFIEDEKDISLKFRGSRNQRLIYLKDGCPERVVQ